MAEALPYFPSFDLSDRDTVGLRWKKWVRRFEQLMDGLTITNAGRKKSLMLHYAGEEVDDICDTLTIPDPVVANHEDAYTVVRTALNDYFIPQMNPEYGIYEFRLRTQEPGETLDMYVTELKKLAKYCEFGENLNRELKSQIIQSCKSSKLRTQALENKDWTLKQILDKGRSMEISQHQANTIERGEASVHRLKFRQQPKPVQQEPPKPPKPQTNNGKSIRCGDCGFQHDQRGCPAKGKTCRKCGNSNHFARCCPATPKTVDKTKSKTEGKWKKRYARVNEVREDEPREYADEQYVYTVKPTTSKSTNMLRVMAEVDGTRVPFILDTGAGINILDCVAYDSMKVKPKLGPANITVRAYTSKVPIDIRGKFSACIQVQDKVTDAVFFVTEGEEGCLLTYKTAEALGLIQANKELLLAICFEDSDPLFKGVGLLKDFKVKLHIDESVPPVARPHRRIPIHLRDTVEEKLRQLEKDDIIEHVDGPTPWVSQPVFPPKSSDPTDIRMCVNMRSANKAILRVRHIMPTIEEIVSDLNGSIKFSKLDLNQGYHQLLLDKESRYITTFTTHIGLWRYKRLNFGICCASEIFQNAIRESLEGISGVLNVSDDILVYGKTQETHDDSLQ